MSSFIAEDMPPPKTPQALLRAAGLRAKKTWGQNFLCDQNVLRAIAQATGAGPEQPVVELGAGLGALTYHLLNCRGQVIAIERDRELVPHLSDYLQPAGARLQIREADAARLDYALMAQEFGPLSVAGNLPYQLSGRILVSLADARGAVRQAVLLVQREVADRLLASPPGREYGLLQRVSSAHFPRRTRARRTAERVFPGAQGPLHGGAVEAARQPGRVHRRRRPGARSPRCFQRTPQDPAQLHLRWLPGDRRGSRGRARPGWNQPPGAC